MLQRTQYHSATPSLLSWKHHGHPSPRIPALSPFVAPPLPTEIISLFLSYLDNATLRLVSCVNQTFLTEAEFHLYSSVHIRTYRQYMSFYSATVGNSRRRKRVQRLIYSIPNANYLSNFILVEFPNLIYLDLGFKGCLDANRILIPPNGYPFKLRSLTCDPSRVDSSFLRFLASHPTVKEINVVCQYVEGDHVPSSVLPLLENLICPPSNVRMFVPGHPITRFELLGTTDEEEMNNVVLPALKQSTRNIEHLTICIESASATLFADIATALPNLISLRMQVVERPSISNMLSFLQTNAEGAYPFHIALARFQKLRFLEYRILVGPWNPFNAHPHIASWAHRLPELQTIDLSDESTDIGLVKRGDGLWTKKTSKMVKSNMRTSNSD